MDLKKFTPKMIIGVVLLIVGFASIMGQSGQDAGGAGLREVTASTGAYILGLALLLGGFYLFWTGRPREPK